MGVWQIIMIVLFAMGTGISLVKHGEPKEGKYSFFLTLISNAIEIFILYKGGFWKG